ncbi:MAG TPA: hypothetical protein VF559_05365 [Caulobacteraceae bacterium]
MAEPSKKPVSFKVRAGQKAPHVQQLESVVMHYRAFVQATFLEA